MTTTKRKSTKATAPNILNHASFETGWDGFTDWSGSNAPKGVTRVTDAAALGQYAVKRSWSPSSGDTGAQFLYHYGNQDHVWVAWAMKVTSGVSTIMKLLRHYNTNFSKPLGGLFLERGSSLVTWGWDEENSAIATPIGLTEAMLIDGKFHTLEHDYWRNGDPSGHPSVGFTLDGQPLALPDGTPVKYQGSGNVGYWKGGRLHAGERRYSGQLGYFEALATLNGGNNTTGALWVDDVSISSLGPIDGEPVEPPTEPPVDPEEPPVEPPVEPEPPTQVYLPFGTYIMTVGAEGLHIDVQELAP